MNYLKSFIDIFSSAMDTIAIYIFFSTVFGRRRVSGKTTVLVYALYFVISSISVISIKNSFILLVAMFALSLSLSLIYISRLLVKAFAGTIFTIIGVLAEVLTGILLAVVTSRSVEVLSANIVYYIEGVFISKAILLMLVKAIQYKKLPAGTKISRTSFFPMMSLPLTTLFIIYLMSEYAYSFSKTKTIVFVAVAAIMLIASNLLVFYMFEKQLRQDENAQQSFLAQQQLQYQTQYYKEIAEKYKLSNQTVHDTKNQLFAVSIAITNNEIEKAKSKIDELCKNVFGASNSIKTGNDALDALLNTKYHNIEQSNINFIHNVFINAKNQIDDIDLCIIVGNALDNAIEACSKIKTTGKKDIELKMIQVGDHLTIELTNPTSTVAEIIDGKIATGKKDTGLHGFGLQSIEELVNKYNGNLTISQKEGRFNLKIYMQNEIL